MAERFRSIFFVILSLTITWLIVILFCLPQDDNVVEHWTSTPSSWLNPNENVRESSIYQSDNAPKVNNRYAKKKRRSRVNENLPPKQLDFLRYFQSPVRKSLSTDETLFYEFDPIALTLKNPSTNGSNQSTIDVTKSKHDSDTLEHSIIKNPTDQFVKSQGDDLFAFNLLVSNRIGLFRPLPDSRNERCRKLLDNIDVSSPLFTTQNGTNYNSNAPITNSAIASDVIKIKLKASIIICYYNEAPSALLRTIHSVLERSPPQLIEELIVIDDSSSDEFHYEKICKPYISSKIVTFSRTEKREGLIRARIFGAKLAKGDVLIFLDSHVEANIGWLEPLLETIQKNKTTIACPMIDLINAETLIYSSSPMVKGGLNWALNFKWDSVPSEKLRTYDDFVKPIESPTMAGGLYAIDRDYFYHLGAYDSEMELWGGENVELSLRTWMCGGRILILPCSRLGHIFRKRRPYGPKPDQPDSLLFNSYRTALIWLGDEYIHKFHEAQPLASSLSVGDISQRLRLKRKLNCQNFSWFLDNIYPSLKNNPNADLLKADELKPEKPANFDHIKRRDRSINDNHHSKTHYGSHGSNRRAQRQVSSYYTNRFFPRTKTLEDLNGATNLINSVNLGASEQLEEGSKFSNNHLHKRLKTTAQFQIQSTDSKLCIESKGGYLAKSFTRLILNHCANIEKKYTNDGSTYISLSNDSSQKNLLNQLWTETELRDFRIGNDQCLDLIKNLPLLRKCHNMGSFQVWKTSNYENNYKVQNNSILNTNIYNLVGGLCLGVERVQAGEPIIVTICDTTVEREETIKSTKFRNSWRQNPEKIYPNWYTGSSFTTFNKHRTRNIIKNVNMLKPNQKWDLIFIGSSFYNEPTTSTATSTPLTSTIIPSLTTVSSVSNSTFTSN